MIRKYLKGSIPGADKLKLIADAVPCSVERLLTGKEPETSDLYKKLPPATAQKLAELKEKYPPFDQLIENLTNIDELIKKGEVERVIDQVRWFNETFEKLKKKS